ncbi:MAG TPA: hypothetical protein VFF65_12850 [Phycisphaerales bacterium]|nr:hypothetical protein [Phycisphaerales bacterium]
MAAKGDYLSGKLLSHVLNVAAFTAPPTVYLALYTAGPTAAGGGTEVAGGSYARAAIANVAASWSTPATGSYTNVGAIQFAVATAGWGVVTHVAILDAAAGGNLLYFAELGQPIDIASGEQLIVQPGDIVITED